MTDTMQAEEVPTEELTTPTEEAPVNPEEGTESSPVEEEKVTFDERQQAKVDQIVGKKVKQTREAERRAQELEEKLKEAEANKPKEERPNIPQMPDTFDEDYDAKLLARDEAIKRAAAYDAQEALLKKQQEEARNEQIRQARVKLEEDTRNYIERGEKLGLNEQQMTESAQAISSFGIDPQIGQYLTEDPNGPLIVDYLARNLTTTDDLSRLSVGKGIEFLISEIKPKVMSSKRTTKAPAPAKTLDGGGAAPKMRGPEGTVYD